MANVLPYQAIMSVNGLSGPWQDRLKQAYKLLTNKDDYTGTAGQNVFVQNKINDGTLQGKLGTPTATQPVDNRSDYQKFVDEFSNILGSAPQKFSEVNPFENYYNEGQINQQVDALLDPYFNKIKDNFQQDINTKRGIINRDAELQNQQMDYNKDAFNRDLGLQTTDTINNTNQNYANSNTFFSGGRDARLNRVQADANNREADYMNGFNYNTTNLNNSVNDQNQALDQQWNRYIDPLTGEWSQQMGMAKANQKNAFINSPEIKARYANDGQDYANNYFNSADQKIDSAGLRYGVDPTIVQAYKQNLKNNVNLT